MGFLKFFFVYVVAIQVKFAIVSTFQCRFRRLKINANNFLRYFFVYDELHASTDFAADFFA